MDNDGLELKDEAELEEILSGTWKWSQRWASYYTPQSAKEALKKEFIEWHEVLLEFFDLHCKVYAKHRHTSTQEAQDALKPKYDRIILEALKRCDGVAVCAECNKSIFTGDGYCAVDDKHYHYSAELKCITI